MRIRNESWLPFVKDYAGLAKAKEIVMVYMEDTDVAGMYDSEKEMIVINVAPNILAQVSERYGLRPSELEKTALAVFLEECNHSQGVDDEEQAVVMSCIMLSAISDDYIMENSGVVRYVNRLLHGEVEPTAV